MLRITDKIRLPESEIELTAVRAQGAGGAGGGAQARLPGGGEPADQPVRDAVSAHPVGRGGGIDRARPADAGAAVANRDDSRCRTPWPQGRHEVPSDGSCRCRADFRL